MTAAQTCFFLSQTVSHAAPGKVPCQSLAPHLSSVWPLSSWLFKAQPPALSAGPASLLCPPNLRTQGLASYLSPPCYLSLVSARFHYLLAVHFQILSIDLHPHNDHLVIPLPPDGCVPEAARVQWLVDTPDDLGRKRGRYLGPGTEGQQVTQRPSNRISNCWGVARPSTDYLPHLPALSQIMPWSDYSFLNVLRMCSKEETFQYF